MADKVDSLVQKSLLTEVLKSQIGTYLNDMLLFKRGVDVEIQPLMCKHLMVLRLLDMGSSLSCCTQTAVMLRV